MLIKRVSTIFVVVFVAAAAIVAGLNALQEQPGFSPESAPDEFTIIASGLRNPRGLVFGPDGSLYIAEAGAGGGGVCIPGPEGEQCYGTSGAVSKVDFDTEGNPILQQEVVSGFSSLGAKGTGDAATGPHDLAFAATGDLYVLIGLGADPDLRDPSGPLGADGINFGQLAKVDDQGNWSNVVDIATYEGTDNPDGAQIDSNPYALLAMDDGFLAVDAGGNDLLNVSMVSNNQSLSAAAVISTAAVFPARMVEFPPGSGQMIPMDSVPTAVEIGPDGAYYVSELTGFPFPVGGANIYRVVANQPPEVYLTGFTNVLDLAWGPDGSLYVLEMAKDSLLAPPPVGQIIQVTPYGARTVIASEGLIAPVDMEIGPDYALYVSNNGTSPDSGQVIRIPLPGLKETIPASKDNTLYESETGALSNGSGQHFFAGVTGGRTGNLLRRGLLAFDVNAALPSDAMVLSATLELHMSRGTEGAKQVTLHTVEKDWGEAGSDAEDEEGAGANAETGDATWLHTEFDTSMWSTPGGDYKVQDSASTLVDGIGPYQWSSKQLTADVKYWLDGSAPNYGWLLLGDESGGASAKRFDSRENPEMANRPRLIVKYIVPLPDYAVFAPLVTASE